MHLSWYTFQFDDLIGTEERFRAHEVSHQWFGHVVEYGHYRDTWINEGMAEYLGYMYYESIATDKEPLKMILENWRRDKPSNPSKHTSSPLGQIAVRLVPCHTDHDLLQSQRPIHLVRCRPEHCLQIQ